MKTRWKVRVGVEAEKDFVRNLKYTADTFGERQASIYKAKLTDAIAALESGPDAPGNVSRDEILPSLRSLHVARHRRGGGGGFRREVQPRRQHWFLNEKSGFPFRTPAFCSVSRGQRRLGEKEYRAPSVTGLHFAPELRPSLARTRTSRRRGCCTFPKDALAVELAKLSCGMSTRTE